MFIETNITEIQKFIDGYLQGINDALSPTPRIRNDSAPLIEIAEAIDVFNMLTCKYDEVAICDIMPVPDGCYITVANQRFPLLGRYIDDLGRDLPIWGLDLSHEELKKLVRADRRAHPKAYV